MFSPGAFTALTICLYLLASCIGIAGMVLRRPPWRKCGCYLAIGAFFCQTFVLIMGFHKALPNGLSVGAYLQMLAWFFLFCGIVAWWRMRHEAVILFAAPLGLILFLMSASSLDTAVLLPASLSAPFFALHIGALFLALGILSLAFIAGVLFLFLQKRLKSKQKLRGFWRDMPALSILDKINYACALSAFPLYTAGIVAGLFWARPVFGSAINGDPKEIASLFIWLLLAALFHNRLVKGWNGRKPALLAIAVFLLSAFSILVINFYFPTHHTFLGK